MEKCKPVGDNGLRCGTLVYTKRALMVLFLWLIWGDICYTLMESVTAPIMLVKFQSLGAMDWEIGLILTTIPTAIYSILNPIISFKSDRYRSRLGRRIPFILFSLPMLVSSLVGLAFADRVGVWLHGHLNGFLSIIDFTPQRYAIFTLGAMLLVFTFFNTFVTSTFWYLFNDVVPEKYLARFMSWFRVAAVLSASFYSIYIFPHSRTHSTEIFLGAAALYLFGFGLMCWRVREGKYDPPSAYVGGATGPIGMLKTYGKECHTNRIYWYFWLCTFVSSVGNGILIFDLYMKEAVGLDLAQIGKIAGTAGIVVSVLVLFAGWLADRYHVIRVVMAAQILSLGLVLPASMVWLIWHPAPSDLWPIQLSFLQGVPLLSGLADFQIQQVYLISLAVYVGLAAPVAALTAMWDPVLLMRTFPRSRYGQFCATNAVWRSLGGMLGGVSAGAFLDWIGTVAAQTNRYFFCPVWSVLFAVPSFLLFVKFYQCWKRYGGDAYVAPVPEADLIGLAEEKLVPEPVVR